VRLTILPAVTKEDGPSEYGRPVRPDLPILRNFSYTKWHALQLGAAFGSVAAFLYATGLLSALGVLLVVLVYRLLFDHRELVEHGIGFHDAVVKPWYFSTAFVCLFSVLVAVR